MAAGLVSKTPAPGSTSIVTLYVPERGRLTSILIATAALPGEWDVPSLGEGLKKTLPESVTPIRGSSGTNALNGAVITEGVTAHGASIELLSTCDICVSSVATSEIKSAIAVEVPVVSIAYDHVINPEPTASVFNEHELPL